MARLLVAIGEQALGMMLVGCRLSAEELAAVRADPSVAGTLLYGDLQDEEAGLPELDLDKAWHGIHYLLTGTAWHIGEGAGAAILGGEPVGPDGDHGQARLLDRKTVRTVASGLNAWDIDTLRGRFDPDAMTAAEIYPTIWSTGSEDFDNYLAPHFIRLRNFYQAAEANEQAVLLTIS